MNKLIIISGPTATGKTKTSIEIAKTTKAQIINFDSLLFYKELNIGTAKPTIEEMQGIIHHQISTVSITSALNAHEYSLQTIKLINDLHSKEILPILVGGSGFYLQAVLKGMYQSENIDQEIIKKSDHIYKTKGITPFVDFLKENDSNSLNRYHQNDHYRIRRAVEFYWVNQTPLSQKREDKNQQNIDQQYWPSNKWDLMHLHLDLPKDSHWDVIQKRTQSMISNGLIDEVEALLQDFAPELRPLKSIGYKETIAWLKNDQFSCEKEFIERINISTRQLAKSQRTWFQKIEKTTYHSTEDQEQIKIDVLKFLAS